MLTTKVIKVPDFSRIARLDLSPELNDSAALIKTDIQDRYKKDIDLDGSPTTPLADSTRERKRKDKRAKVRANADKPLVATGNMMRNQSITKATKQKQTAVISIGPTRDEIYSYHHEGGVYLPQRQKFGIGDGVPEKIDELVTLKLDRLLAAIDNGP